MMPRLRKFYARITLDCLRKYSQVEWLEPDLFKELMNIDEFRNEVSAYRAAVTSGILTRNEARERLGFGTRPEADKLMIAPNQVPLEDLVNEEEEEFEEES